jgi:hypothetical protein
MLLIKLSKRHQFILSNGEHINEVSTSKFLLPEVLKIGQERNLSLNEKQSYHDALSLELGERRLFPANSYKCFLSRCNLISYGALPIHCCTLIICANGPAIKGVCVTRRSHPATDPGTLAEKLSRCKEGTAQFLQSGYKFG